MTSEVVKAEHVAYGFALAHRLLIGDIDQVGVEKFAKAFGETRRKQMGSFPSVIQAFDDFMSTGKVE